MRKGGHSDRYELPYRSLVFHHRFHARPPVDSESEDK